MNTARTIEMWLVFVVLVLLWATIVYVFDLFYVRGFSFSFGRATSESTRAAAEKHKRKLFRRITQYVSDAIDRASQTPEQFVQLKIDRGCLVSDVLEWSVELDAPVGFQTIVDHLRANFGDFEIQTDAEQITVFW